MNTNQFKKEKKREEDIMSLEVLRTSKRPDTKNSFQHKEKEKAFKMRYGKDINTSFTYDLDNSNQLTEYTMRAESNGNHYSITEYMINGATDYVIIAYHDNGKVIENRFDRYVDAEIKLADLISQEE